MSALSTVLLLVVGLVNFLPVVGVVSAARLQSLYGVVVEDPNLLILMRHRAVLFGIVGGVILASGFFVSLRPLALAAGLSSMVSFVLLAWQTGTHNAELRRVVRIDVVASLALVTSALLDRV